MIRAALESDVSAIVEIYNHYIKSSVVTFELEEISTQDMLERMKNIHSQGHCWLVSESEGITLPNKASVALHEKFEMEQVAHFKEVGFKFSKWLDVGYWQLKLNK